MGFLDYISPYILGNTTWFAYPTVKRQFYEQVPKRYDSLRVFRNSFILGKSSSAAINLLILENGLEKLLDGEPKQFCAYALALATTNIASHIFEKRRKQFNQ